MAGTATATTSSKKKGDTNHALSLSQFVSSVPKHLFPLNIQHSQGQNSYFFFSADTVTFGADTVTFGAESTLFLENAQ
jgi:hypothetical protein